MAIRSAILVPAANGIYGTIPVAGPSSGTSGGKASCRPGFRERRRTHRGYLRRLHNKLPSGTRIMGFIFTWYSPSGMLSISCSIMFRLCQNLLHPDHVAGEAVALGEEHLLEVHLVVHGVGMTLAHVAGPSRWRGPCRPWRRTRWHPRASARRCLSDVAAR